MRNTLSESERKFLLEGKTSDLRYAKVIRYRIRQKLLEFLRDDLPALKRNEWTERWLHDVVVRVIKNCNQVTEISNQLQDSVTVSENQKSVLNAPFAEKSDIKDDDGAAGGIRTRAAGYSRNLHGTPESFGSA